MKNLSIFLLMGGFLLIILLFSILLFVPSKKQSISKKTQISIIAAENFYGDLAVEVGGSSVHVTSILSDPNIDPHEYESDVHTATLIANADIVIENGLGYDTWMDKLLYASPNTKRIVLRGEDIAKVKIANNPHVWYEMNNMSDMANALALTLIRLDPTHSSEYVKNVGRYIASFLPNKQKMEQLRVHYNSTPIGLTETIFQYEANDLGLHVMTPIEFQRAIAEGNDPSAQDVNSTNKQIQQKQIKILIYNAQTVMPITNNLLATAKQANIPIVRITELMPEHETYQSWMLNQLLSLQNALQSVSKK